MIYCLDPKLYPTAEHMLEEITYQDENGFDWKIARVSNGFFVKYLGDPYFKDNTFECETSRGQHIRVKNTNCIFIEDPDFDTFYEVRNLLILGYTDEIWETFNGMFEERFEHDLGMLESEMVKGGEE